MPAEQAEELKRLQREAELMRKVRAALERWKKSEEWSDHAEEVLRILEPK